MFPGQHSPEDKGLPRREPALRVQHGVRPIQALPAREAEEPHHLPRHRQEQPAPVHQPQVPARQLRGHPGDAHDLWAAVARTSAQVRGRIQRYLFPTHQYLIIPDSHPFISTFIG